MKHTDDLKDLENEFIYGSWKKFIICVVVAVIFWGIVNIFLDYAEANRIRQYAASLQRKAGVTKQDEKPETINFDALHKISEDAAAWIYAPDTEINYVIAHTDSNRYYLDKQLNTSFSMGGTLFINCKNSPDLSDLNTIIYGHYTKNGTMFGSIMKYDSQDYYKKHQVMYLYTPGHKFRLKIFAAYTTWITDKSYEIPKTIEERDKIVANAKKQSKFVSDVTVGKEDKLVTLSTCIDDIFDKNYVVVGKLVEE